VMQIENDYDKDVYNGDIGKIECINLADGELVANFDGRADGAGFSCKPRSIVCARRCGPRRPTLMRFSISRFCCNGGTSTRKLRNTGGNKLMPLWVRSERHAGVLGGAQGLVQVRVIEDVPEPIDDLPISL